jgi:hypothetical protein
VSLSRAFQKKGNHMNRVDQLKQEIKAFEHKLASGPLTQDETREYHDKVEMLHRLGWDIRRVGADLHFYQPIIAHQPKGANDEPASARYSHAACFRREYGGYWTDKVLDGTITQSHIYRYWTTSASQLTGTILCDTCKEFITRQNRIVFFAFGLEATGANAMGNVLCRVSSSKFWCEFAAQASYRDLFTATTTRNGHPSQRTHEVIRLESLFAAQLIPVEQSKERAVAVDLTGMMEAWGQTVAGADPEPKAIRERIGAYALATSTTSEAERRASIEARLPVQTWPPSRLLIVAVDTGIAEEYIMDRASGVSLIDAVAASCAVPSGHL